MSRVTDIRPLAATLYFLPVAMRTPLKFGHETVPRVTCARVCLRVRNREGREAVGWGETPLSVTWVWPSTISFESREKTLAAFCVQLSVEWARFDLTGDAMEVGHAFQREVLPRLLKQLNASRAGEEP